MSRLSISHQSSIILFAKVDVFSYLTPFTLTATQIVKLRAANLTLTDNFYFFDSRRMERECLLNSAAICNTANLKGFGYSTAVTGYYCSLKYLDTFLRTLFNPIIDSNRVANLKLRHDGLSCSFTSASIFYSDQPTSFPLNIEAFIQSGRGLLRRRYTGPHVKEIISQLIRSCNKVKIVFVNIL